MYSISSASRVMVASGSAASYLGTSEFVMSTARKNSLTRFVENSTTNRVLELTAVPVEVIAGDAVSGFERWGIPAAIGTALALFFMVED